MTDQIEEGSSQLLRIVSSCEKKAWKNSGLNGIRTHDLCDAGEDLFSIFFSHPLSLTVMHRALFIMKCEQWPERTAAGSVFSCDRAKE